MLHCIGKRMRIKRRVGFFLKILRCLFPYPLFPLAYKIRQFRKSKAVYKVRRHMPSTVQDHNITHRKGMPCISFGMIEIEFLINSVQVVLLPQPSAIEQRIIASLHFHPAFLYKIHIEKQVFPAFPLFINLKNAIPVIGIRIEQFFIGTDHRIVHLSFQYRNI